MVERGWVPCNQVGGEATSSGRHPVKLYFWEMVKLGLWLCVGGSVTWCCLLKVLRFLLISPRAVGKTGPFSLHFCKPVSSLQL